jgi:hypothetical protein
MAREIRERSGSGIAARSAALMSDARRRQTWEYTDQ